MKSSNAYPWRDTIEYIKLRLEEAIQKAELAIKFLDQGLHRNASGKVFQTWKALISVAVAKKQGVNS